VPTNDELWQLLADPKTWATLYFLSEWAIRLVMLAVVPLRRTPDAAKGWLLLLFFLPWLGLALYFFIGRPRFPRWRGELLAELLPRIRTQIARLRDDPHFRQPELPASLGQAVRLASELGRLPVLGGTRVELLPDYDGAIERLVADIDAAERHAHLLYYIFADDRTGGRVIEALRRAAARGVACRVLFDSVGSKRWRHRLLGKLRDAGVDAHPILPVHLLGRRSARFDLRNHRKIAVIDGRVALTGSQNLVDADFKPGIVNDELVVRLHGPVVLELQAVFAADWFLETGNWLDAPDVFPAPQAAGDVAAQALPSGPDFPTENVQRLSVALLHGAIRRATIVTPYFIPDPALLQAVQTAVLRGVEVHLVASEKLDQWLVGLAQRSYYDELLQAGVRLHLYCDKLLHAKHLSVDDDLCLIGSSNMDQRSFLLNSEISVLFYDTQVTAELRVQEERYFAHSRTIDLAAWRRRPAAIKLCENLARLMSPLL
jgi:cardiolipin synthase